MMTACKKMYNIYDTLRDIKLENGKRPIISLENIYMFPPHPFAVLYRYPLL